ncbi:serine hydrolase [Vibrio sp. Sgm 22]|uniref:serine hydrolase domain-containing protein n=1 Tax=unclassified Vibrio TaxID=2614977 RepID=UPI0022499FD7|nr:MULTISPECIES: serine hydrolase domain-containing protein [unclassified Vibrio]MCX2760257.1 serine hydrolase [Vibrio sp. 14G-20]MCX2777141.1 serine hydrolase [Vibrio sp. Sgm 22]
MKTTFKLRNIALLVAYTLTAGAAVAESPLEKALAEPGAKPIIPVTQVKEGFDKTFIDEANAAFGNFHMQMGGDHALYYAINMTKYVPAELAMPHGEVSVLKRNIDESLNDLTFTMGDGSESVSLNEYIHEEKTRVQGIMILKGGEVVYEEFPGMNPYDTHLWASVAKSTVGTLLTMLEAEGKVDMTKPITEYVPELKGTEWDNIIMLDAMNMASGLDISENAANTLNPRSVFQRMLSADFHVVNADGVREDEMKVLRDVVPLEGEPSGEVARYSSTITKVLGVAIENITQQPFTQVFEDRIWSKIGARASAQVNVSPAGHAVSYGLVHSRLDDLARYGLLFTPSWDTVAQEQVISNEVLEKMQKGGNHEAYMAGDFTDHSWVKASFGKDMPIYNTHQWDAAWEDGALFKHGNLYQNLYVDPVRDVVGVAFSTSPVYLTPDLIPGYLREAAKQLADK